MLFFGVGSLLAQALLAPLISVRLWEPDFVLVIVLLMAKRFGGIKGSSAGFFLGLLQDAITGLPLGISAMPKAISGYLAGKFHGQTVKNISLDLWFIIFILIHEVVFYGLFQFKSEFSFQFLLFSRALPNTIYTTISLLIISFFTRNYFSE